MQTVSIPNIFNFKPVYRDFETGFRGRILSYSKSKKIPNQR